MEIEVSYTAFIKYLFDHGYGIHNGRFVKGDEARPLPQAKYKHIIWNSKARWRRDHERLYFDTIEEEVFSYIRCTVNDAPSDEIYTTLFEYEYMVHCTKFLAQKMGVYTGDVTHMEIPVPDGWPDTYRILIDINKSAITVTLRYKDFCEVEEVQMECFSFYCTPYDIQELHNFLSKDTKLIIESYLDREYPVNQVLLYIQLMIDRINKR